MGKTVTIAEFKAAFKRPDRPKDVKSKDKGELEKLIKKLIDNADKENKEAFQSKAKALYTHAPNYFVELLTYKLANHYKDDEKRPYWVNNVPSEALEKALAMIFPAEMSEKDLLRGVDHAVQAGEEKRTAFLYRQSPEAVMNHVLKRCAEFLKDETNFTKWKTCLPGEALKPFFRKVVASKNSELVAKFSTSAASMEVDELTEMASAQPAVFIEGVLKPFKNNPRCIDLLKNSELRSTLKRKDPESWSKLVAETPQLSMFEAVKKRVKEKGIKDKNGMAKEVFDALVSNDGIELTYYTNRFDPDNLILTGGTPEDQKVREEKTKMVGKEGAPEKPATQCHNFLAVLRHSIEMLGVEMQIKSEHIQGILLTKPLKSIGGKGGLIDSNFKGNVVDDAGQYTGQIVFTGNEKGEQSHTWLVIDGVPYDPVLGTAGSDVKKSKANEFNWILIDKVAKSGDGWYIVKEKGLQAAPNKHGFSSGYRLTKDPTKYGVTAEEIA